jgi:hypothetical protein
LTSKAAEIKNTISLIPANTLINVSDLYSRKFRDIPEKTYYKVLERMTDNKSLVRLTRGIYYCPKKTRFGNVPISENEIVAYYTESSRGVVVGYTMYNRYGLTTQIGKRIHILSNALKEEKKNIGNVSVEKADVKINDSTKKVLEVLDVLRNYSKIEDMNRSRLDSFLTDFSKHYQDVAASYVLDHRKYKKRTIAFLKDVLDYQGVENTLGKYLSDLSDYKVPEMEEIFAAASI